MPNHKPSKSLNIGSRFMAFAVLASLTAQTVLLRPNVGQIGIGIAPVQAASQQVTSKAIVLLLASSREQNPQKAIVLLQKAREEIKKENLPAEDAERILALIDSLEQKARAKTPTGPSQNLPVARPAGSSTLQAKLPVIADLNSLAGVETPPANSQTKTGMTASDVEATLAANPEIRDAMWEIGRSRLSRDARNLDAVVQERDTKGRTPEQIDAEEANIFAEAMKPGPFAAMLDSLGLSKLDFTAENKLLIRTYEGVSINDIANHIIKEKTVYGAAAGFAKGLALSKGFIKLGVTAEVLATFMINSRLVLQLANLYGIELADSEKQLILLIVFAAAKAGVQYGVNSPSFANMMHSLGTRLGTLQFSGKPAAMLGALNKIVKSPTIARWISPELRNFVGPMPQNQAAPGAPPVSPSPSAATVRAKINAGLMWVLKVGMSTAASAGETVAMGIVAKRLFAGMRESRLQIHNENFRRFLMTPTSEGFFKVLVLTMNEGRPSYLNPAAAPAADQKAKLEFIMNIARSARMCSPEALAKVKSEPTAKYACQTNQNMARFERLKAELLTYDEIPQHYVTDLRALPREIRTRMAELVLLMQFLDGDRSPDETQYFRMTVSKSLGVDRPEDLAHFERLHAFIHDHGGMTRAPQAPTGFTIRGTATQQPYNLDLGYLPLGAPEAPEGARYIDAKPVVVAPAVAPVVAPPTVVVTPPVVVAPATTATTTPAAHPAQAAGAPKTAETK